MPIVSKKEARRQYAELTGLDDFRKSYDFPITGPDIDLPSGGALRFISAENEAEAASIQNRIPESYGARRRRLDDGFEVAIYEKPETREKGSRLKSKIRSRWGSFR